MFNRLAQETSPYLLQHRANPVDWYAWGDEALRRAREENRPILLSIGYAACHWCHVMAHESFEDAETADIMNRHFVNIKVDREERPDLDNIYMTAVQAMTGQGGWPMTMFLTPDGTPFYGGTYFPPTPRYGMPGFKQVLQGVINAWQGREAEVRQSAARLAQQVGRGLGLTGHGALTPELLERAVGQLAQEFDQQHGGFGGAPKFPPSMTLEFLLRMAVQRDDVSAGRMAQLTLEKMAQGGMYDQIGGGFARYSVDERWLVPHFEKMLYDNAQLARVYLHAWQVTRKPAFRQVVEDTLDWVQREMTHADGGFYSSLDADSQGEEGRFYVWSLAEIQAVLGEEAELFVEHYGVTQSGNWEGHNILHVVQEVAQTAARFGLSQARTALRLAAARKRLRDARAQRVWPGLDDKVLTAWNGLMLAAFAEAGWALERADYTATAVRNAEFFWREVRQPDGRLRRTWKAGAGARLNGYLEDYAFLADGLLALYQNTFAERWFVWAQELTALMQAHFRDEARGGFYDTSDDHETLIHRPKDVQDNAIPSANAMAARVLFTLSLFTGDAQAAALAEEMTAALAGAMSQYPNGFAHWLGNAWLSLSRPLQVAIAGQVGEVGSETLIGVVREKFRPNLVLAVGAAGAIPLLQDRPQLDGQATAYICENFACQLPITLPAVFRAQLDVLSGPDRRSVQPSGRGE